MNKKVRIVFKATHEQSLTGTCTELYELVEQAAAKEVYPEGTKNQINNNIVECA